MTKRAFGRGLAAGSLAVYLALAACGGGGSDDDAGTPPADGNVPGDPPPDPGEPPPEPEPDPAPPPPVAKGFQTVSDAAWDETAVRKVLHTFAYGGQATDDQIRIWADMPPKSAIAQMLTFDQHNPELSPVGAWDYDGLDTRDGTLHGLAEFWSSDDPDNGIVEEDRESYSIDKKLDRIWLRAALSRGLNPFRHKIGLWETNYHMAVNLDAGVTKPQLARYYDDVLAVLEDGQRYFDVLAEASASAAVATQYGHRKNEYRDGVCECNEDFAREYYQLFFGILGDYDPFYHETVTIKNMAAALTHMEVARDPQTDQFGADVNFGTEWHFPGSLEMLQLAVGGSTALERIDVLSPHAIEHPESLDNLPVKIIRDLADDELDRDEIAVIREAWADGPQRYLLPFLRDYAVSTSFHDEDRVKRFTSVERLLVLTNRIQLDNEEGYLDLYAPHHFENEGIDVFRPLHNVFGGQTGTEAAESSVVFRNNYNRLTDEEWRYRRASVEKYSRSWIKDWATVTPLNAQGQLVVSEVAAWLWNRLVADGLKNFQLLEQAHVYALLATGRDLIELASPDDLERIITSAELVADSELRDLIDTLAAQAIALNSPDSDDRLEANQRVGRAINFIAGTPFVFAQEGR